MLSLRNIAVLVISIPLLTQLHDLDVWISDAAYDFNSSTWLIDHADSVWRVLLYDGPKALLILFALTLIVIAAFSPKRLLRYINRREAVFLLICLAVVPGITGVIRQNSGVNCPYAIQRYGGRVDDSFGHFQITSYRDREAIVGCWPSGHASGGFALLALAFLNRPRKIRVALAVGSVTAGTAMGVYQIFRGAHFASHIVLSLGIALLLIAVVLALFPPLGRERQLGRGISVIHEYLIASDRFTVEHRLIEIDSCH